MTHPSEYCPLRRHEGLLVEDALLGDEAVICDPARSLVFRLDHTAYRIWELCDGTRTVQDLAQSVDGPLAELRTRWTLQRLHRAGLIADPTEAPHFLRLSRRQMGAAALAALPVVVSGLLASPAEAASLLPSGSSCSDSTQCQSNVCWNGKCFS